MICSLGRFAYKLGGLPTGCFQGARHAVGVGCCREGKATLTPCLGRLGSTEGIRESGSRYISSTINSLGVTASNPVALAAEGCRLMSS